MAVTIIKRRLRNPHEASKVGSRRATRNAHRNPGELVALGFINPQQGTAVKTKKANKQQKARRPNPHTAIVAKAKAHNFKPKKRNRNPELSLTRPVEVVKAGTVALGGLVATRQLPQLVLGSRNTGILGYLSNAAAAGLTAFAANKLAGNPAAYLVMIGGALYIVDRIITEQFSPIGQYFKLAGVGDAKAAAGMGRLGTVKTAYFPHPVLYDRKTGAPLIPQQIDALRAAQSAAVSKVSGVSRLQSRLAA